MEKKEISSRTAVKGIITGFASYGIIILILYKLISSFIHKMFLNNFSIDKTYVYVCLAVVYSIIILITMHLLCRLSTYDLFKKCKIKKDDVNIVSKRLTIAFIIVIFVSIISACTYLYMTLMYEVKAQKQELLVATMQYSNSYSQEFTDKLTNEMLANFDIYRKNLIAYTFILELGFCISLIAISPFQKSMIEKYNT